MGLGVGRGVGCGVGAGVGQTLGVRPPPRRNRVTLVGERMTSAPSGSTDNV